MKTAIFSALATAGLALSGSAAAENLGGTEQRFDGVDNLVVSNFTGRIEVNVGGDRLRASLQGGEVPFPLEVSQNGANLLLEGPERPRRYNVHDEINWRKHKEKAFAIFLEDYPILKITAPAGTNLDLDDAISIASIGDLNGVLIIEGGFVEAVAGDLKKADVSTHGSGDITLGAVKEELIASVHGSGDIKAKSSGPAAFAIHGSGDISVGDIKGDAVFRIHGSGDIAAGDIGGAIKTSVHGSGSVNAGRVQRGADFAVHGSGDVFLRSINGPAEAAIFGSGSINIDSGRAENLHVTVNGSGDFELEGVSTNLTARINGSGAVLVAKNEGNLSTAGRGGHIRVNGVTIDTDD